MTSAFIDTSFLIALVVESDEIHDRALAWKKVIRRFVTTEFVLLEVGDTFSKANGKLFAQDIFRAVASDDSITLVPLDSELLRRGQKLFFDRLDKDWSLTDCISFEVMRDHSLTDALTHDHHFEQAGFRDLLRFDPPSN